MNDISLILIGLMNDPLLIQKSMSLFLFLIAAVCLWRLIAVGDDRVGALGGLLVVLFGVSNGVVLYLVTGHHGCALRSVLWGAVIGSLVMFSRLVKHRSLVKGIGHRLHLS